MNRDGARWPHPIVRGDCPRGIDSLHSIKIKRSHCMHFSVLKWETVLFLTLLFAFVAFCEIHWCTIWLLHFKVLYSLLLPLHELIRVPSCIYLLCAGLTCSMLSILHFYSAIFLPCFPILTATTSVWPWLFFIFPISTPICSFINFIGRLLSSCSCLVVELCELFCAWKQFIVIILLFFLKNRGCWKFFTI